MHEKEARVGRRVAGFVSLSVVGEPEGRRGKSIAGSRVEFERERFGRISMGLVVKAEAEAYAAMIDDRMGWLFWVSTSCASLKVEEVFAVLMKKSRI